MLVGIYKLNKPPFLKKTNDIYKKILDYNNIAYIELSLDDPDFWDRIKDLDVFIFRWAQPDDHHQIASTILPIIENSYGIKCFPDQKTCWHYDDKIKEYYLLKSRGYPFIDSYIFWEKENAIKWVNNTSYPIVFKLKNGAGSTNVILIKNKKEAQKAINKMFGKGVSANSIPLKGKVKYKDLKKLVRVKFDKYILNKIRKIEPQMWQISKNYVLFQKFLPNNSFDTRVTTIGNRVFASRRFTRKNDFRASGSGLTDFDRNKIDIRMIKIAQKISKDFNFQSMAYDFLINEYGDPEICEVSYTYADISISNSPGYWDENLIWHTGKFWPEYLHIIELLGDNNIKQPKLE